METNIWWDLVLVLVSFCLVYMYECLPTRMYVHHQGEATKGIRFHGSGISEAVGHRAGAEN